MNEHRLHNCSVERTLDLIGDRWTFLILREAFFGVRRFGQLARNLKISRNLLSERLQKLVAAGVLQRRRYRTDPTRYEYRLTPSGRDLYPAIVALMHWGDKHLAGPEGPPLLLRHRPCGIDTIPLFVCLHCGTPIKATDIDPHPGPGAFTAVGRG